MILRSSDDIINLVLYSVKEGYSVPDVSKRFKISKKTVRRWLHNYADEVDLNKPISTRLIYNSNPPYSPEFNPIELAFNKVKCNYRKCNHENMINDINQSNAMRHATITSSDCQGFYEHSFDTKRSFIQKYN